MSGTSVVKRGGSADKTRFLRKPGLVLSLPPPAKKLKYPNENVVFVVAIGKSIFS